MTPQEALDIAARLYGDHPAAAALMLEAIHSSTEERRLRSALALRCLDPQEVMPFIEVGGGAAWQAAVGIAVLLVSNVSGNRRDRQRCAGLLSALCREAARLRQQEAA